MAGTEACPARPWVVTREAERPLLGAAHPVQAPVAVGHDHARALVEQVVAAGEVGTVLRSATARRGGRPSPRRRPRTASPRRAPAASPERARCASATASAATCDFMSMAPRPHTCPSWTPPSQGSRDHAAGVGQHRVEVPEVAEHRPAVVRIAQPGDQVGPLGLGAVELGLQARVAQVAAQPLGRGALVPRRVDGAEPDQLTENRRNFPLQLLCHGRHTTHGVRPALQPARTRPRRAPRRAQRAAGRADAAASASTRSSARSTCSARERRCGRRSSRARRTPCCCSGRPARARRRSRGWSPASPTMPSRSCPPCRPGAPRCGR